MSYLLHIDASSLTDWSVSRKVAASFLETYEGDVVHRDLAVTPAPHLTEAGIMSWRTAPEARTPEQAAAAAVADELVDEFLGASAYLFTVPMYNYSMPSVFKAWLDQVSIVGRTMHVQEGSAAGREALVVVPRGGSYGPGTPSDGLDFLLPTLEVALGSHGLGLVVTSIVPEWTLAPISPALSGFSAEYEASLAASHERARELGAAWSEAAGDRASA
ncbi:NAD(P)H-dependent oxidoreductase [Frondihabitans cladoniiphilus]|uniref:FMN dependent NADH:quinone oxidoreductase n=2 Tax=Frondihabitans cladoniiphilus TaxID=715785 RepID=A0ABP8VT69_9MICO